MSERAMLICGFSDRAAGLGGLAWRTPAGTGGLLSVDGEARRASIELDEEGEGAFELRLEAGGDRCIARLSPALHPTALSEADGSPTAGGPEAAICRARVEVQGPDRDRKLECEGHLTRWSEDPLPGAELVRHLAIPAPDGALLVLISRRGPGAEGHDAERCRAWLLEREGTARAFDEALLSTQYDERGHQTRAGLELWTGEAGAPPMRAAGTLAGPASEADGVTAALLETSAEDTRGQGGYVIRRG